MLRMRGSMAFFVAFLVVLPNLLMHAQNSAALRVDEHGTRIRLAANPTVEIPVINVSDKGVTGTLELDLLNTNGTLDSAVKTTFQAGRGNSVLKIVWPPDYFEKTAPPSLGWQRLRYKLIPEPASALPEVQGIVQLSQARLWG